MLRKPCSKCGSTEYDKYRRTKKKGNKTYNIISSYCIRCQHEDDQVQRDPDKRKASQKRWVAKHQDHLKAYRKKYRNTDEYRKRKRAAYHKSKVNDIKGHNISYRKQYLYAGSRENYIRELDSCSVSNLSDILLYGNTLGV